MNRLQYRIVFNKQRGQLMAVAETVRAQTKTAGQTDGPSRRVMATADVVVPTACGPPSLIALAAALAMGAVLTLLPAPAAQAQSGAPLVSKQKPPTRIVADPSAPKNQQPTVLTAPNGTPLVNIQTPSAAGVSRNTYGQFDVGPDGVILNNSRGDVNTQLGGWVQGNPWMGKGEARVILNEVNSSAPSQLNGYVEVAGRRAEVIIANPAGIQVDGGGFINASSAILTTGTPRLDAAGNVSGFAVQGGLIRIDGAGLDGSSTDYTALLSRAVELNAGFWAKEARIQTGTQVMSAETAGAAAGAAAAGSALGANGEPIGGEALPASGDRPRYALDSTALGGIYAQRIILVGTEAGLGVRQAGQVVGGQLTLRADGWLDNTGTVYAQQAGADALLVSSATGVSNAGWMAAKGSVTITAPRLQGERGSVTAAGMNDDGALTAGAGTLALQAADSQRQAGSMLAADQLRLTAPVLDLSGSSGQGAQVSVQGREIHADAASLTATGTLQVRADGMLTTRGASLTAQQLQVAASDIDSRGGEWLHLGQDRFSTQVSGQFLLDGGRVATNALDWMLSAGSLSAVKGQVEHYGNGTFSLTAAVADLTGAALTSYGDMVAQGNRWTLDGATVLARSVSLTADQLSLQQVALRSATTATLSGGAIDHRGGVLTADQGVRVTAGQGFNNDGGQIHAAAGSVELTMRDAFSNRGGVVAAQSDLTVTAGAITQADGAVMSGQDVGLRVAGAYREAESGVASSVLAAGSLSVSATDLLQTGVMRSGGHLSGDVSGNARIGGSVYAQGSSQWRVTGDAVVGGWIGALSDLTVQAGSLRTVSGSTLAAGLTETGQIQSGATLALGAAREAHLQGELLASATQLRAASLDLTAAQVSTGALQLQAGQQLTTDGATLRTGQLDLQAGDWSNRAGQVTVTGTQALQLQLGGQWDNRLGSFQTNSADVQLSAARVDNRDGLVSTSGDALRLQTRQWQNEGGLLIGSGSLQLNAVDLTNAGGQISARTLGLEASQVDNGVNGVLAASGSLQWTADTFRNGGVVQAGESVIGTTRGLLDNQGLIRGMAGVQLHADRIVQDGTVAAQGDLVAHARAVSGAGSWAAGLASDNTLSAPGTLTMQATESLQLGGPVMAGRRLSLASGQLALQGSQLRAVDVTLSATQGDLRLDRATIGASGGLSLSSAATLSTADATLSGATVTLSATDWSHRGGSLAQTDGGGALTVRVSDQIDNTRGTVQANAADVLLQSQTFIHTQGHLLHAGTGSLRLDTHTLEGAGGEMLTRSDLTIVSSGAVNLSDANTQARQIDLTAGALQHQGGQLLSSGALTVSVAGDLDNSGGLLQSQSSLIVSGGRVMNRDGQMLGQDLRLSGAALQNDGQGLIHAQSGLTVAVGDLRNAGALQSGSGAEIRTTGDMTNTGVLRAQGDLTVTVGQALRHTGSLTAQGSVMLSAERLSGTGTLAAGLKEDSTLAGTGDLTVRTTGVLQQGGPMLAAGQLSVRGASLQLQDSRLQGQQVSLTAQAGDLRLDRAQARSSDQLAMTATGAVNSQGAQLVAGQVALTAVDWQHTGGQLVQTDAAGALDVRLSGRLDNTDGKISANAHNLHLQAAQITNTRGNVTHAGSGALTVTADQWSGAQGQLLGAGSVAMTLSSEADLRGATTQGAQSLTVSAGALQHQTGRMLSGGGLSVSVSGVLDNAGGQIGAASDLHVSAATLANQNGQLAGQSVTLEAGSLSNTGQGSVMAQGALTVRGGQVTNEGALQSGGPLTLALAGALSNSGSVYSLSAATVDAGGILNNHGLIAAQAGLSVQALSMQGLGTFAAGLKADNTVGSTGDLQLQSRTSLQHGGTLVAGGTLQASGTTLQLQGSQVTARQVTLQATQGDLRLDGAVLASGGGLALTSLAGQLNTQAATLSGASVDIEAQHWRHAQGVLTQTAADGHLAAQVAGTLDNQGGQIQAVGDTLTVTAQRLQNTQGRIVQAASGQTAAMRLDVGNLSGAGGQLLSTGALDLHASGTVDLSAAVTQAHGLTVSAAALNHQAGKMVSTGAASVTVTNQLDNRGAALAAAGPLTVDAGSLANGAFNGVGGTVQSDGALDLRAGGALDNQSGRLRAAGLLTVDAGNLDNRGGVAAADDALSIVSRGALSNEGGSLIAGTALTLDAASIGNQRGGQMASLTGGVTLRSQGLVDNSQGSIQAAQATTVTATGLLNQQGEIAGHSLTIDTRGQALDNSGGRLLADGSVVVESGAFENRGGLVQAGADLTVRTHGGALSNTRDLSVTTSTGLLAQGGLTIDAGSVLNETAMSAGTGARITSASLTNRGEIAAGTGLDVAVTNGLDNQGGRLIGVQTTQVSAAQILNQGGLLYGGQTLTVTSGVINNSGTTGSALGLQGGNVTLTAQQLDNRAGQVLASGDLRLTLSQSLDNRGGQLGASGRQTVGDGQAPTASALSLNNSSGRIWSGTDLALGLRELAGGQAGQMSSGGDLSLALQGDLVYGSGSQIQAAGNTTLTVTGQFTNQGVLRSGGVLSIGAANISNEASGELSGGLTLLHAAGALTNRGLIDGDGVSLTADRIVNLGTGRVYGTNIALTGGQLINDAEGAQAAVIAARQSLDAQFTRDVLNRAGALVFADGSLTVSAASLVNENASIEASQWLEMAITGAVENRTVYSGLSVGEGANGGMLASKSFISSGGDMQLSAGSLVNSGATLEARGNLLLKAADIRNLNPYLGWFGVSGDTREGVLVIYVQPRNEPLETEGMAWDEPLNGRTVNQALRDFASAHPEYLIKTYEAPQASTTAEVTQSSAGQIVVGGLLVVEGGTITNDMSMVVGRDGVAITGAQVNNVNREVQVFDTATGMMKTVPLHMPTQAQTVVPGSTAPDGRASAGTVTTGPGATGQQGAGRPVTQRGLAALLPGLTDRNPTDVQGGAAASVRPNMTTGWRRSEGPALATVEGGADAGEMLAATAERRQAQSVMAAVLRDASAAVVNPSADGRMKALAAATAVTAGSSATAKNKPAAAGERILRGAELTFNGKPLARSVQVNLQVPTNSLFKTHAEPTSRYLVETDPRFANYRDWLSSDYLLQQLAVDPATTQKRLGDGFYEQRLVREQLGQLTGNAYLPGYASDEDMYRALLSNGATFGKDHQLIPGVALTAEQMTQLTTDLVWLVEQEVTLADGTTQRVLVPQVYLVPRDGDLDKNGSLIAGDRVEMALSGDFVNEGTLRGGDVRIQAQNVGNSGSIRGASVALTARDDLKNVGGTLAATADLSLVAGRSMDIASTTASGSIYNKTGALTQATVLDKVASLSAGGVMVLKAGQDVTLQAAQLQQGADGTGSEGGIGVQAGRDVTLSAIKLSSDTALIKNANNYKKESVTQDSGTTVDAQGFVTVKAGQDLTATAAEIKSSEGAVTLAAGRDVQLLAGEARQVIEEMSQKKKSGFLKKKVTTTYSKTDETVAVATTVSGDTVAIMAGQDLLVKGSNVVSDAGTSLVAGGDVTIEGVTQTLNSENFSKTVKSGLMGGGGIGFTIGKQSLEQTKKNTELTSAGSMVASVQGDVSIVAGEAYKQVGSTVSAPAGDVSVLAKRIDIEGVEKEGKDVQTTSFRSSGLSLSVSAPALSALTSTVSMAQNIGKVSDARMAALGAASTAIKAKEAVQALQADPKAAGGLSISITVGSSQSKSRTETTTTTHQGSEITAGGDIRLTAQGAGADSDIHIQGTDLAAAQRLALKAEGDVSLISAQDRVQQKSSNSSSSASVGVAVGVGSSGASIGLTASASLARGKSDGDDVIQRNTHLQGQQVSIESGGDTTLKGAVVSGDQVKVAAGGNLSIESLQDTSKFKSESMQVGGSATFGVGFSGSVSGGQSKIKSDYASVTEQSGIRAGDGGFQVEVKGHTDLKGGAITSTQAAVDAGVNSFQSGSLSLSDIQNKADYKGSSYNVSVGFGKKEEGGKKEGEAPKPTDGSYQLTVVKPGGAPGNSAGFGYSSGSDSSVTLAGISGVAGNASARTGDAETGIKPIFDKSKVQQDLAAQVAITQTFGKEASQQVGDYAQKQMNEAQALLTKAQGESDPARKAELKAQAAAIERDWGDYGLLRLAAHTVIGGLTGNVNGAVGAAAGTLTAPAVADALKSAGVEGDLAKSLTALASTAVGAAVGGGAAGGVTAFNEVTNNYLKHAQVLQKKAELAACKTSACRDEVNKRWTEISKEANNAALDACVNGSKEDCRAKLKEAGNDLKELQENPDGKGQMKFLAESSNNIKQVNDKIRTALEILAYRANEEVGATYVSPAALAKAGLLTGDEAAELERRRLSTAIDVLGSLALPDSKAPRKPIKETPASSTTKPGTTNTSVHAETPMAVEVSSKVSVQEPVVKTVPREPVVKAMPQDSVFDAPKPMQTQVEPMGPTRVDTIELPSLSKLPEPSSTSVLRPETGSTANASGVHQEPVGAAGGSVKADQPLEVPKTESPDKSATNPSMAKGSGADSEASTQAAGKETTEAGASCANPPQCFVAGTLIHTVDGPKPIETFVGGELVLSRHEHTGEAGVRPVVATVATKDQPIYEVVIEDALGNTETLHTTAEHPFWVVATPEGAGEDASVIRESQWVRAASLTPGMRLVDMSGVDLFVRSQSATGWSADVFNVEVHEHHTYHVGVFAVWAHNAPCCKVGNVGNAGLEGVPINGATRTVPLGFNPPEQFTTAAQQLQDALVRSGVTDATVGVRGSSVTGVSLTKGTPFGPQSDIDFFIESRQLTEGYKTSKNIPGFVHPGRILPDYPMLRDWSTTWTNTLGRDVTPGAFVPGTLPSQPSIVVRPIGPVTPITGG